MNSDEVLHWALSHAITHHTVFLTVSALRTFEIYDILPTTYKVKIDSGMMMNRLYHSVALVIASFHAE